MPRPFPLQTLLDLALVNSDAAAARLCAINGHDREMEQRLQLLLDYRNEYTAHLAEAAKAGMNSVDWRNFRLFIDKIDAAIVQQRDAVAQSKHRVKAGQRDWHVHQRQLKSFDTLFQRHLTTEIKRESRQEQKEQDEFALRGYLAHRLVAG
jgi:flagellar FliJ protein